MRRILALAVTVLLAGCAGNTAVIVPRQRAVVIVSGLASTSPFTTPKNACGTGLAAGSADTAIRAYLLGQGRTVYTAPTMAGPGQVHDQTGFGAFASCPAPLPDAMTVDTSGSIDLAGAHLARFLTYLHADKGVNEVDLVGHSMGGLYARSAIRALTTTDSPVKVRSLVTVGTPWQGSYLADFANGTVPLTDCAGDQFCESQMRGYVKDVAQVYPSGSAHELGANYLTGAKGWNQFQAGALDGVPVTVIGGNHFTRQGGPTLVWPNDGIVALRSAIAVDIDDAVLPRRRCYTFDATHSDYVSMIVNLPKDTALTWDPQVLAAVNAAIENAPQALDGPNREGCPA